MYHRACLPAFYMEIDTEILTSAIALTNHRKISWYSAKQLGITVWLLEWELLAHRYKSTTETSRNIISLPRGLSKK